MKGHYLTNLAFMEDCHYMQFFSILLLNVVKDVLWQPQLDAN